MAKNNQYHDEFAEFLNGKDYQQAFWESDLGYLWYQGNLQQQNKYFELALRTINENKYISHLDVGCGWGELTSKVSELSFVKKVLGIDISESIIAKAKELNKNIKAIYQCVDVVNVTDKFDVITLFGSTDYITPDMFLNVLKKIILLANKEVIIVNSLRKIKFEDSLKLTKAIEIRRYDTGYVHPINYILDKLKQSNSFTYEIIKFGLDSALTVIKIN
ncbi:MAG: class I SAM-dependent methyltransferase [Bacteroidia bacterium]